MQEESVSTTGLRDRDIKERPDLAVLKFKGPALLIELGFIANDKDRGVLLNPAMREKVCKGVANVTTGPLS